MDNFKQENIFNDDTKFCSLCNVAISSKITAHSHFNGRLHKSQVERMKTRERQAEKGIFIRRDDMSTIADEELISIFKKYGEVLQIRRVGPNKPFCVLKFADGASVQRALSEPIYHRGKILQCSQEKPFGARLNMKLTTKIPPSKPKKQQTSTPPSHELINIEELPINNDTSFEDAVNEFIKEIEAPPGLEEKHKLVCADLEQTFAAELPGVKARLFGSTITGLAFKDSDLDIFMECPNGQPPLNFVAKKAHIMYENDDIYTEVYKVTHARAPIIKFTHVETNLNCDVAFNDKIGLRHCSLIKYLISLDSRLRHIFILIKYWGKYHCITTSGNFPNFALIMMIIFYFQQLENPILPSVKFLQDSVTRKEYIGCWESSFSTDRKKVPVTSNESTKKDHLNGFFKYFSRFDHENFFICPLLGRLIKKDCFRGIDEDPERLSKLPDTFINYKTYIKQHPREQKFSVDTSLCVQDPINLSFNIMRGIANKHIGRFFWLCGYACEIVFKNHSSSNLLEELYSPPKIKEPKEINLQEDIFIKDISMTLISLPDREETELNNYNLKWFRYMKQTMLVLFEKVFKLDIEDKNLHFTNEDVNLNFNCFSTVPVFHDRKRVERALRLPKIRCLENEIKISDFICKEDSKHSWGSFKAHFSMTCYFDLDPPRVSISFSNNHKLKFNTFIPFTTWININIEEFCSMGFRYLHETGLSKRFGNQLTIASPSTSYNISLSDEQSDSINVSSADQDKFSRKDSVNKKKKPKSSK